MLPCSSTFLSLMSLAWELTLRLSSTDKNRSHKCHHGHFPIRWPFKGSLAPSRGPESRSLLEECPCPQNQLLAKQWMQEEEANGSFCAPKTRSHVLERNVYFTSSFIHSAHTHLPKYLLCARNAAWSQIYRREKKRKKTSTLRSGQFWQQLGGRNQTNCSLK